jgi:hypothetical protein
MFRLIESILPKVAPWATNHHEIGILDREGETSQTGLPRELCRPEILADSIEY